MSRGNLEGGKPDTVGKNACTKMFDRMASYLWLNHGLFLFHFMDGRIPQEYRDLFTRRWNLKYGKRP